MELNITTATNEELQNAQKLLENEFNSLQSQMKDMMSQMENLSQNYNKIQSVLDKRGGKK